MGFKGSFSNSYTQQKNKVSKKTIRTIVETTKRMMEENNLDESIQTEEVATVVCLLNRSSTKVVHGMKLD